MAARREKNVQVYAEDVTDVMMEEITKIAQEAFHLNFDEFLASKVFTRIADHIRTNLDKRYGQSYCVIVGRSFGAFVTHRTKSYMFFSVTPGVNCLVWKI